VDGVYVCVAYSSEYKIINMDTGHIQDLFSFDSGHLVPTITKISRVSFVCFYHTHQILSAQTAVSVCALVVKWSVC